MPVHDPEHAAPAWLTAGSTVDEVIGLLKTGKEAEVFVVERRTVDGSRAAVLAHKRYRPVRVTHKGQLEALGFSAPAPSPTTPATARVARWRPAATAGRSPARAPTAAGCWPRAGSTRSSSR